MEKEPWCRELIEQRIRDGLADPAPIMEDVCSATLPECDGFMAGFPCQGTSRAGDGKGLDDPRSSLVKELWRHWDARRAQRKKPILD